MQLKHSAFSYMSPKHHVNQDSFLQPISSNDEHILGIADGIGGKPGGEVASSLAINELKALFLKNPSINIESIFTEIHKAMTEKASLDNSLSEMGTTLTVCKISGYSATIGHVGDTRLYHLRGEGIMSRTKDQTEVQKLLDDGVLTRAQASVYPRKNILLSSLTALSPYDLYTNTFELLGNDRLILLSDGVYRKITPKEISAFSIESNDVDELCKKIEECIKSRIPDDDYTTLCVEVL